MFLRFIRMARIAYAAAKTSKMVAVTINHVEVSTSCPCCKTCTNLRCGKNGCSKRRAK